MRSVLVLVHLQMVPHILHVPKTTGRDSSIGYEIFVMTPQLGQAASVSLRVGIVMVLLSSIACLVLLNCLNCLNCYFEHAMLREQS